jgi:preprotein translocase subunit YajC
VDQNILTIGLVLVFAVMLIFMFRNSRKRQRDQQEMQSKMVPGAEVMTSHGIFGTLISLDEDNNEAVIETTPGTQLRVHRQTLSKIVEPTVADEAAQDDDDVLETADGEPEFGERVESVEDADIETSSDEPAPAKAARTPRKKASE